MRVEAVAKAARHDFSKGVCDSVNLLAGLGVEGDAHMGETVKHRSRVAKDPQSPNLRQVHLIHGEFLDELAGQGFAVAPGAMGENITTRGVDLLNLPRGARLSVGGAVVEITGLRNPCSQLNAFLPGLTAACIEKRPDGGLVRKAGVMAVVIQTGAVRTGDAIEVHLPAEPHERLTPV